MFEKWLEVAICEARKCVEDVPIGAVVVLGDRVVGYGRNMREASKDPTAHAEIVAIREAAQNLSTWRLEETILYSTLEPCAMCAEAIIQARVAKVVFGAYDPASGACGSRFNLFVPPRIYPIPEVVGGIEEESCKELLTDFFKSQRA